MVEFTPESDDRTLLYEGGESDSIDSRYLDEQEQRALAMARRRLFGDEEGRGDATSQGVLTPERIEDLPDEAIQTPESGMRSLRSGPYSPLASNTRRARMNRSYDDSSRTDQSSPPRASHPQAAHNTRYQEPGPTPTTDNEASAGGERDRQIRRIGRSPLRGVPQDNDTGVNERHVSDEDKDHVAMEPRSQARVSWETNREDDDSGDRNDEEGALATTQDSLASGVADHSTRALREHHLPDRRRDVEVSSADSDGVGSRGSDFKALERSEEHTPTRQETTRVAHDHATDVYPRQLAHTPADERVASGRGPEARRATAPPTGGWAAVNRLLVDHGFRSLALSQPAADTPAPDPMDARQTIHEVLMDLQRKRSILQEMHLTHTAISRQNEALSKETQELRGKVRALEKEAKSLTKQLSDCTEEHSAAESALSASTKKLQKDLERARYKVSQWEHKHRAKERDIERLQKKLEAEVSSKESRREKDQFLFQRLFKRDAKASSVSDKRTLEVISMYEAQREQTQKELTTCRKQLQRANEELRDKENYVQRMEKFGPVPSQKARADSGVFAQLEAARRERDELQGQLAELQDDHTRKINELEQQLEAARRRMANAEDRAENLEFEIQSRPTVVEWREMQAKCKSLQDRCDKFLVRLQRQKSQKKGEAFTIEWDNNGRIGSGVTTSKWHSKSGPNASHSDESDSAEDDFDNFFSSVGRRGDSGVDLHVSKYDSTRKRIQRDKDFHRLGLGKLARMDHPTCVEALEEICRELDVNGVSGAITTIRKLLHIAETVPRTEAFVRDICDMVLNSRQAAGAPCFAGRDPTLKSPRDVIPIIQWWQGELGLLRGLQDLEASLATELSRRLHPRPAEMTHEEMMSVVRELVEFERATVASRKQYALAEESMRAEPSALPNRVISHFQRLFEVKELEGVFPALNQIYLKVNEGQNFQRALATMLGLDRDASGAQCLQGVRRLLDHCRQHLSADLCGEVITGEAEPSRQGEMRFEQRLDLLLKELQKYKDITNFLQQLYAASDVGELPRKCERSMERLCYLEELLQADGL
eukprot:Rmarinus@m.17442